ncbi:hypothetical protein RND81_07G020200 [Saponaria officinalis]|uniref:Uncharacterized protein n=1 Tax=Saponaria officinalis TaxID=3572 RepID=A0AAW1JK68_SAPOF
MEISTLWSALTGLPGKTHNDTNSMITHPCLRLLHRFLNNTFLGLGSTAKAPNESVELLWSMLPFGRGVPDWVNIFVWAYVRKTKAVKGKMTKGKITMGGLITMIGAGVGIKLSDHDKLAGNSYFDVDGLADAKMITRIPRGQNPVDIVHWLYGPDNVKYLDLPRPIENPLPF